MKSCFTGERKFKIFKIRKSLFVKRLLSSANILMSSAVPVVCRLFVSDADPTVLLDSPAHLLLIRSLS